MKDPTSKKKLLSKKNFLSYERPHKQKKIVEQEKFLKQEKFVGQKNNFMSKKNFLSKKNLSSKKKSIQKQPSRSSHSEVAIQEKPSPIVALLLSICLFWFCQLVFTCFVFFVQQKFLLKKFEFVLIASFTILLF